MPSPINIKNVPANHVCCGNVILYLDQLWKITKIEHSESYPHINFQAERQICTLHQTPFTKIQKDILNLTRVPETMITVIENSSEI